MTPPVWHVLLAAACAAVLLWGLHALAWWILVGLLSAARHLPALRGSRTWARARPLWAWLRLRHPRLYSVLAARVRPTPFTSLPLTLFVLGALYVLALLSGLTEEVVEKGAVLHFDRAVNASFGPWRDGPLIAAFLWITALGFGSTLTAVSVTATGFLWVDHRPRFILPLWVVLIGAEATTWAGKYLIARHRPEFIAAASATSPSFPSAHATGAMAVYGFLAYALVRELPGRRARFEVIFCTAVLIAAIGFSRIFLSVHYTTDVLAGILVGGFWLLVGFGLSEWRRGGSSDA
jgi:membrane-associated phospholipid phosphatase